jgi:hypothetical protein
LSIRPQAAQSIQAIKVVGRPDRFAVQAGDCLELVDALLQTLGGSAPVRERLGSQ